MLDIRWVRENVEQFNAAMRQRGTDITADAVLAADEKRRTVMTKLQELQSKRNELSKSIGTSKSKGDDASALFEAMKDIGPQVKILEEEEREANAAFDALIASYPNIPQADVPVGADDTENVEVRRWGTPRTFKGSIKHHYELGEELGLMDFENAAKIAGSRFAFLRGDLARLERALANFMLDLHVSEFGFEEMMTPMLVNDATAFGTGQLPKFSDDLFQTTDGRWLLPTSEVPLTNFVQDNILKEEELPLKFCAWTQCFRKEAGSAGRDTRGYIRMHQFGKVEMVQIVHPEKSAQALEFMTNCAEEVLKRLELPYRVVTLCTGDMGFCSQKTYDIEVWLPAQNTYREISSCSNCGSFQARRMKARFKDVDGNIHYLHTLNGSGLATGRTLVAVMENYQEADGSIRVPDVLIPYMGGKTRIEPRG